ncbi:hypothetical protein OGAPHI_005907 [Ogataea philodendri]|uniref:Altered inheritance of mitochondria protein 24, mitochondrial n=1 Tax=Ogataea philodendri TaxID=1378263 RepID=A0A9P8T115_9ASCO|nr:uncharacterized protein OGAPHI_005907 [Ogataea philodendri]KAH3661729.1 hypothetical protein OGAPHI_005907 [Ogataea philodendri]
MFRPTVSRKISFKTILSSFRGGHAVETVKQPSATLPSTVNIESFVESPEFEVLGKTSGMLNIRLPQSSILNLRYNNTNQSIIALNGKVSELVVELGRTDGALVFQRCLNGSGPMSILMANKLQNANFSVVQATPDAGWTVKRDNLVAWAGNHLLLNGSRKLVNIEGSGKFVLSSPGQTLQLSLQEGESISVSPSSVVAFTGTQPTGPKSLVDFGVPGISWLTKASASWSSLKSYVSDKLKLPPVHVHPWLSSAFAKTGGLIKRAFNRLFTGNPDYMIEFSGPRTLLITNGVHFKDKIMTEDEIEKLKN